MEVKQRVDDALGRVAGGIDQLCQAKLARYTEQSQQLTQSRTCLTELNQKRELLLQTLCN